MNKELLKHLNIDSDLSVPELIAKLEEKRLDYLSKVSEIGDSDAKKELDELVRMIGEESDSLKKQMEFMNSAIILEDENSDGEEQKLLEPAPQKETPKKETPRQSEEKKDSAKTEKGGSSSDADRIAKLKDKRAKEQANEQNRAKAAQSNQGNQNQGGQNTPPANLNSPSQSAGSVAQNTAAPSIPTDIKGALVELRRGNYAAAVPALQDLSEKGDVQAQVALANCYLQGQGVRKDYDRYQFWLQKAADGGDDTAQTQVGVGLLASHNGDDSMIKKGYHYLEMAAAKGNDEARRQYINAALLYLGGKKEFTKAIEYCNELKAKETDSYNRQQFDKNIKELKGNIKAIKQGKKTPRAPLTIGGCLWLFIKWYFILGFLGAFISVIFSSVVPYLEQAKRNKNKQATYVEESVGDAAPVAEVTEETAGVVQLPERRLRITAGTANIRSGPGTEHGVVGSAKAGTEYFLTGNTENPGEGHTWYEIYLDESLESIGWVSETVSELIE